MSAESTRRTTNRARLATAVLGAALVLSGCSQGGNESIVELTGTAPARPQGSGVPQAPFTASPDAGPGSGRGERRGEGRRADRDPRVVDTIAEDLAVPWGLDFFPDGDAIVTERDTGRVLRISGGSQHRVRVLGVLDGIASGGEGGLLGVAVSPDFETDQAVYFYLTTADDNRVVRSQVTQTRSGEGLTVPEVLLEGIPDAGIHDGGRLAFGPDGYLYASTGDADQPELAQDRTSLGGKILRITTEGDPAPGNPFDSSVWSYGHRNVQGLAFDARGTLWASEFGQDAFDELNRIRAGDDYGWPRVEGEATGEDEDERFTDPQQTWPTDEASPSGLAFAEGSLWMGALQGERLWRIELDGRRAVEQTSFFVGDYGRLRTIALAPDGTLWVTTSNRDGRGDPQDGDDRILSIRP